MFPTSSPRPARGDQLPRVHRRLWCLLFSHPADFTPVCTTELGATAKLQPEWAKRGVKVLGLSVDSAEDHGRWIGDINETQGAALDFPIIADKDRQVSMLFGMLDATHFRHGASPGQTQTVRNVYIISPSKRVELILSYPAYVGRSFDEILRVLDARPSTVWPRRRTGAPETIRWFCRSSRMRRRSACLRTRAVSAKYALTCVTCETRRCDGYERHAPPPCICAGPCGTPPTIAR